jgi:hypothetical protein
MLEFLCAGGTVSERKLRLFACACCRRIGAVRLRSAYGDAGAGEDDWDKVLATSERFADGAATAEELQAAVELAERVHDAEAWQSERRSVVATAVAAAVALRPTSDWVTGRALKAEAAAVEAALQAASEAAFAAAAFAGEVAGNTASAKRTQAVLLRELFGPLPFRPMTSPASALAWNGGTVVKLARSIYDGRRFGDLPVLADALVKAGCPDPDILQHCRGRGEHERGCWVVDLVTGKV